MNEDKMPSANTLLAEVLTNHCGHLQHKVSQGETQEVGIFWMDGIPFVFDIDWEFNKDKPHNFHFRIYHVRPRSKKIIVDRHTDDI